MIAADLLAPSRGNFERDAIGARDPGDLALVERAADGSRRTWTFGALRADAAALAGALVAAGVRPGGVVVTLVGNRPEWAAALLACFRAGFVALPCTTQLRAGDLAVRAAVARPVAVIAETRFRDLVTAAGIDAPVLWVEDEAIWQGPSAEAVELGPEDPALATFTSGTSGAPKCVVHGQRYLWGQRLQARSWMASAPGDLVWCTAASGWSKSARNAFLAPWLTGAAALVHDGRFDADERLEIATEESVAVLCMAPTEYRVMANRGALARMPALRSAIAAGEALDPEVLGAWRDAAAVDIRDGYGQTETGQVTGAPPGEPVRPGSMGRLLPGVDGWLADDGELCLDPATVPTFFLGYLGDQRPEGVWRTGDRMRRDDDGWLFFESRTDDVIISSGYRIGPFEVETVLSSHPAVADVAVVAQPDPERGQVVRAVVVAADGHDPSDDLAAALQAHCKATTAPYKYPRVVDFVAELPRTASGKVRRALLRDGKGGS